MERRAATFSVCLMTKVRILAALATLFAVSAQANNYVFPHVTETSGSTQNEQNSIDTNFVVAYQPALQSGDFSSGGAFPGPAANAPAATLYVYLINSTGLAYRSTTDQEVCNPCSFSFGGANALKQTIRLQDEIVSKGGFASPVFTGSVIMASSTGSMSDFAVSGITVNAKTGPFDLSFLPLTPSAL